MLSLLNPFEVLLKELQEVKQELREIKQQQQQIVEKDSADVLLSINETCALFQPQISRPTLYSYEKQGLIQRQMIGSKICFSKKAVLAATRTIKRYKGGN
jgi:hypothetical protein